MILNKQQGAVVLMALLLGPAIAAGEGTNNTTQLAQVHELTRMSLEELASVQVTSVSKTSQQLSSAPAAIYVITHEEILRAGVTSIPEALRLAPNLQVAQLGATSYAITARGFGDKREVQTQANKLLILIDGRSVYSPLFSGVFYDALDVFMEDVDRIEVISGPGATLWGANAMNGVINIITRSAAETGGAAVGFGAGNQERAANARYGGALGQRASYRIYGKTFERDALELDNGSSAHDGWNKAQGGFRIDWNQAGDGLTLQGDIHHANQNLLGLPDISISGVNALTRWRHTTDRSQLQVQVYYDRVERDAPVGGAAFKQDTYDIELQHSFALGHSHRIVWGAGERFNNYHVINVPPLLFLPPHRSLQFGNVFAQDVISLSDTIDLTVGMKLEESPYSGWTALPDLRLSWVASDTSLVWAAASRAIRSPTPFDVDVTELVGGSVFLTGNPEFQAEKVQTYELGYRSQPASALTLSLSAFYNEYDDLRTVEITPVVFLPLLWGNRIEGSTYGVEGWANVQVTPWWRLSPGVRTLRKHLRFKPGASGLIGVEQSGNDPKLQASLKSSMDIGSQLTLDAFLRYVSELPDPQHDPYYELSASMGWKLSDAWQLSLTGFNLLHERHTEYAPSGAATLSRSVFVEARWRR